MATQSKVFGISVSSVAACAQISALADSAVFAAVEFIAAKLGTNPTLEQWDTVRVEWRGAYMVQRDLDPSDKSTANALDKAWSRYVVDVLESQYGLTKPKATSESATKKAAQRAKPEAVEKAQSVTELEAIALPDNPVEAAKLQAQIASKRVSLIQAEQKAAQKEREAALKARGDALIAFVRECVKTGNAAVLAELEAMRDHDVPVMLTAVPLKAIQEALPGLIDLAASAPAKVAKKGRKAVEPAPL